MLDTTLGRSESMKGVDDAGIWRRSRRSDRAGVADDDASLPRDADRLARVPDIHAGQAHEIRQLLLLGRDDHVGALPRLVPSLRCVRVGLVGWVTETAEARAVFDEP